MDKKISGGVCLVVGCSMFSVNAENKLAVPPRFLACKDIRCQPTWMALLHFLLQSKVQLDLRFKLERCSWTS